jgi:hypothetical protein
VITADDAQVASAITDPSGHFTANLLAPGVGGTFYWVNAQDAGGGGDFSVLHVTGVAPLVPAASAWGLAALGALLVAATALTLRRRRAVPPA